MMTVLDEYKT